MDKKTLIILPGWGGNKDTWREFANLASEDFEIKIIDLPCFGDEPCPETAWGVEQYVDFVRSKIFELKTLNSELFLLGHSFGGQIATVFASKYSEIISKLILLAPAVFRPKKNFRRLIFTVGAKLGKLFFKIPLLEKKSVWAEKIYHQVSGAQDYHDASGIKREIFKKIIRQDQGEAASKITIPTLIIWGTADGYLPVKDGKRLQNLIPESKLEIIKGGKHGLHLQMPKRLWHLIKKFASK